MLRRTGQVIVFHKKTIRRMVGVIMLVAFTVSGCIYPVKVSSKCQSQINQCLLNCEATPHDATQSSENPDNLVLTDHRSFCEQQCHSICHD